MGRKKICELLCNELQLTRKVQKDNVNGVLHSGTSCITILNGIDNRKNAIRNHIFRIEDNIQIHGNMLDICTHNEIP